MFDSKKAGEELREQYSCEQVAKMVDFVDELIHFADEEMQGSFMKVREALMEMYIELD